MMTNWLSISRCQLDRYALDDDVRFWLELDEQIELYPIRDFKCEVNDTPYEHHVSLDLDTRVLAMNEMFNNKHLNIRYVIRSAYLLREKCIKAEREDLVNRLDAAIEEMMEKC